MCANRVAQYEWQTLHDDGVNETWVTLIQGPEQINESIFINESVLRGVVHYVDYFGHNQTVYTPPYVLTLDTKDKQDVFNPP